ncbi:SusC/RagA family TonB-linked outer membrane protein [Cytophagaceae bacterium YF14B1]|uniref:SusC/RagA family TonB-linked outer membrane protein n=1 Tax=Xanthocytophaga flava TaxID=3048013 RepID=A0AAE3QMU2_9BACT|nr:SusC/RagA family TonB-linked outer membrane protein [Xanthocytophaga flavus]MDJ1479816.1 SusC/RagA family TonB-linked outer membrane protein [Xanthocytophaga flavus]
MKKLLFLCALLLMSVGTLVAQDRTITGKITDEKDGSAIPGVNITVKGTTRGTVTDVNGAYTLSIPSGNQTIVVSFIGYATIERPIGAESVINISLQGDTKQLNEVIVTAQGIERTKNELSYAAQKVDGDAINRTRDANFVNSLSGKVSGVQITRPNTLGGSTNVVIRGTKSLGYNNQALFVIDGVPIDNSNTNSADQRTARGGYDYGNAAADINSDDIESLTVLKGAAATALYGSRASNGVVLITTKKGSRKGLGLTVNSGINFGVVDKSTLPKYQKQYGGGYGKYYGPDPDNDPRFFNESDLNGDGVIDYIVPTSEDASYGAAFDPTLNVYQWDAFYRDSPNYGKATPWVGAKNDPTTFFQNPVSNNHNIMLDGGGDKGFYKLGYTRNDEKGILPNSRILKDFVNFSASYNISPKFTATAAVNFSDVQGKGRYGTGYDSKNIMTNFRQWWQTNVDIKEQKAAYERSRENQSWNLSNPLSGTAPIYWDNPYWVRNENYETDERLRYFGYGRLDYKVNSWLSLMGRISLDTYNETQEERIAVGSVPSSLYDPSTSISALTIEGQPSGYSRFTRSYKEYNYDLMATINKNLSEDFNLKAVLGSNVRRTTMESVFNSTNGGLVIPRLYAISNSVNQPFLPIESFSDLQVNGFYANVTLGYKNLLFLDLAGRRDRATSLPRNNDTYYYPSVSTSFVFSELLKELTFLTGGKLRVNYAEVGNLAPTSKTTDYYSKVTSFGEVPLYSVYINKNNANLKPERTRSFEAGVEMSFLADRVGFDFTYYKQNSVDQIIAVDVSRTTGYDRKFVNAGNVQNQGIELSVFGKPVQTKDFSWTINVNFTRNRNKVLRLFEDAENLLIGSLQGGVGINARIGQPYGTITGSGFKYMNGQKIVGDNGYYLQTTDTIIGNVNPDWIGGISNTLRYKNLSLGFLVDVKKGGDVFSLDMYYGLATGLYPETAGLNDKGNPSRNPVTQGEDTGGIILGGVKEDGTRNDIRVSNTNYGVYGYRRNPAAAFVYDGSYIKLREVSVSYSFPQAIISKLGPVKGIDLSFIGRNLWIIHKNLPYADPEDQVSAGNIQGYQTGAYPNVRNFGFNVKLRF